MPEPLPQLWELGEDIVPGAEVAALAAAERADVALTDRIRGWRGCQIHVDLPGGRITGIVLATFRDAVTLAEPGAQRVVRLAATCAVEGPGHAAVRPAGRERGSGLSACRDWVGCQVTVFCGVTVSGRLSSVGADHLDIDRVGGVRLVPWSGVSWVRVRDFG